MQEHNSSILSGWALLYLVQEQDNSKVKELYNGLTDRVKDSGYGINLKQKIDMMTKYLESEKTKQDSLN